MNNKQDNSIVVEGFDTQNIEDYIELVEIVYQTFFEKESASRYKIYRLLEEIHNVNFGQIYQDPSYQDYENLFVPQRIQNSSIFTLNDSTLKNRKNKRDDYKLDTNVCS